MWHEGVYSESGEEPHVLSSAGFTSFLSQGIFSSLRRPVGRRVLRVAFAQFRSCVSCRRVLLVLRVKIEIRSESGVCSA